jgi:uracil-DNA glycosylase family 4
MSLNEELKNILTTIERFLKQQQELYGETIFVQKSESPPIASTQIPVTVNTRSASPETDLFGNIITPITSHRETGEPILPAFPNEPWAKSNNLEELNNAINTCMKCDLGKTRINFVFGVGNPKADVVIVGEAPGADEDEKGEPFVGRAGQLLNKILEAIHFKREEVFICNILKCRPPNNRDPQSEEIDCCEPYLWKQLEIIKPKMILCAGRIAGQSLLKTNASLALLRSKMHDYRGIPLMVTYHPAALLRNPNWKRPCWEDMQQFRKQYDEMKKNEK